MSVAGVQFDPKISLGAVFSVASSLILLIAFFVTGNAQLTQTQKDVASLQAALAQQAASTRSELRESLTRLEGGMGGLQAQVALLPDLGARLRQVEIDMRRVEKALVDNDGRFEGRRTWVDRQLDDLKRATIEQGAMLDNLRRASGLNLPGARGVRP